jgi:hypothetical protein
VFNVVLAPQPGPYMDAVVLLSFKMLVTFLVCYWLWTRGMSALQTLRNERIADELAYDDTQSSFEDVESYSFHQRADQLVR